MTEDRAYHVPAGGCQEEKFAIDLMISVKSTAQCANGGNELYHQDVIAFFARG
jgi:hypothetical protein